MKKVGILLFVFANVIAALLWSRKVAISKQPKSENATVQISTNQMVLPSAGVSQVQQSIEIEPISNLTIDESLALIRVKLVQLARVPKADKGGEDELMIGLQAILTDDNAAEITRALSVDELQSRFGRAALQRWLKVDVGAAADWVAARADASPEQAVIVARELIDDSIGLTRYCFRLPENSRWSQVFLEQAVQAAMRKDPNLALCLTERLNSPSVRLDLMQTTVYTWMTSDPTVASEWIMKVQNPLIREELICVGAKTLATVDPLRAIDWLNTSIVVTSKDSSLLINETMQDIFGIWVQNVPAEAARAVLRLPSGNLRQSAMALVACNWFQRDPAAATVWMNELPERETLTAIFRMY